LFWWTSALASISSVCLANRRSNICCRLPFIPSWHFRRRSSYNQSHFWHQMSQTEG
jgi:hypothetical protein